MGSVGRRRGCQPDTLKGSEQASCNAGRPKTLSRTRVILNQRNLEKQREDSPQLLSTVLSVAS